MTTILRFQENGVAYAKGFINQEGLSLYVLPGYRKILEEAIKRAAHTALRMDATIEESASFPGDPYPSRIES